MPERNLSSPTDETIRVVLVDDHSIVNHGLQQLFATANTGIRVVGEAGTLAEGLRLIDELQPDVAVLDLNMGSGSGLETLQQMAARCHETKIVVYSMREAIGTIRAAYKLGARGYVTKSADPKLLIDAIRQVRTRLYVMQSVGEHLLEQTLSEPNEEPNPVDVLTKAELQIFLMLAQGMSNDEVSEALDIPSKTVASRSFDIRQKLRIRITNVGWTARKHGLLPSE